ncbi:MAG: NACHT domain-containing protein, partial [Symploca sp. SIO1B1]|nr:NACHT domain-containing protein [Symploca sp. SIO1B1]
MEVETRLESSLHNRVYIIPDKDKNSSQVEHPWNIDVKSGSKPKFRLPKNTHIITVFDQAGVEGRLLILGKPGAGKTTMLLELAKVLVQRAEKDLSEPVPILLSLSSWQNDQQSIADWIVAKLNSGEYHNVRKDIAKQWLEEGEIIPLLDGLDELAAGRQESCVKKLNEFLQPG